MTKTSQDSQLLRLTDKSASHGIAPGMYPGSWSGSRLRVETPTKLHDLETVVGIRGWMRVVVDVARDGSISTREVIG